MKVRGKEMRATWWTDDGVAFLDQRRVPHALEVGVARTADEAARVITDMGVRGAPLIGVFAAYALAHAARCGEAIDDVFARLLATRPTAINLKVGLEHVLRAGPDAGAMLAAARAYDDGEVAAAEAIGMHGLELLRPGMRILTHCNAGWLAVQDWGTALAPVYKAARAGLDPFVWVSETRPRLQGSRLTAWELAEEGVRHAVVVDGAAADLMRRGEVDLVITGADRVAANGDVVNKIGTYDKACAARVHGIPFHVAAPATTIDPGVATGADVPIEERAADELRRIEQVPVTRGDVAVFNPAFDLTPAALITGLVTEVGRVPATAEGLADVFRRLEERSKSER